MKLNYIIYILINSEVPHFKLTFEYNVLYSKRLEAT